MPPPRDRASPSQALLQRGGFGAAEPGLPPAATKEPPPLPWVIVLPLIAGLSLALWGGVGGMVRLLWAE